MKTKTLTPDTTLIVLDQGEAVIATLSSYCAKEGIAAASLTGIGAVTNVECGYYNLDTREYVFTTYPLLYEVVSLSANVALKEGVPFVHMHAVFSDTTNHTFGGHVAEMIVGVTLEIVLSRYPGSLTREYDKNTGLYLLTGE